MGATLGIHSFVILNSSHLSCVVVDTSRLEGKLCMYSFQFLRYKVRQNVVGLVVILEK